MSRNHVRNSYTLKLIFVAYVDVSWFASPPGTWSIPVFTLMGTEACYYQTLNPYPPMDSLSTKSKTTN
ncbi:hypothetical protein H9L39_20395 [Fusarium oxysporum f. sp. albedinis]|nr:hypothetical protein H9L39_20395 [Fusarium oxysporum f. sp. albedinis]